MSTKQQQRYIPAMVISLVKSWFSDKYELTGKIVFVDSQSHHKADCQLGDIANYHPETVPEKWIELEHFGFNCRIDPETGATYGNGPSWNADSDTSLSDVARMAKASTKIERALAKAQSERGYVTDAGDWFGRVAAVIGCNVFLEALTDECCERYGYRYRQFNGIGEAINRIRNMVDNLNNVQTAGSICAY